ncbi:hypothetical protein GOODEAATRI_032542, partial [Goodea atripinnis]
FQVQDLCQHVEQLSWRYDSPVIRGFSEMFPVHLHHMLGLPGLSTANLATHHQMVTKVAYDLWPCTRYTHRLFYNLTWCYGKPTLTKYSSDQDLRGVSFPLETPGSNQDTAENCDPDKHTEKLTWSHIQVDDADGIPLNPPCWIRLANSALICPSVITHHVPQSQRHVSVLHLSVLQLHPVLIFWMLVKLINLCISIQINALRLQIIPGPLYIYNRSAVCNPTWQNDVLSRFCIDVFLICSGGNNTEVKEVKVELCTSTSVSEKGESEDRTLVSVLDQRNHRSNLEIHHLNDLFKLRFALQQQWTVEAV